MKRIFYPIILVKSVKSVVEKNFMPSVTFCSKLRITFANDGQNPIQPMRGAIRRQAFPLRVLEPPQPRAGRGRGAGKLCPRLGEGQNSGLRQGEILPLHHRPPRHD